MSKRFEEWYDQWARASEPTPAMSPATVATILALDASMRELDRHLDADAAGQYLLGEEVSQR